MREARKSEPLISVIVPVYKTEAELPRCIESLLAQTHKNLEIILVDDGSPDSCGAICDSYAEKDRRIRVIHQRNQGVSVARNAALEAAQGEYIGFMDSDDWAEPGLYGFLCQIAEQYACYISICGYFKHMTHGSVRTMDRPASSPVLEREQAIYHLLRGTYYDGYLWNKLFKRDLFFPKSPYNRMEPSIHICEDLLLVCTLILHVERVAYVPQMFYHYFVRDNSALNTYNERRKTELAAFMKIERMLTEARDKSNVDIVTMRCAQTAVNLRIAALKAKDEAYARQMRGQAKPYLKALLRAKSICTKEKLRIWIMYLFPGFSEKIWIPIKNRFHISWSTWQ